MEASDKSETEYEAMNNRLSKQHAQVHTSAIVKYPTGTSPANYRELADGMNINSAPANWLKGQFGEPWVPSSGKAKEYSSFQMANAAIDQVGKVDVISDAENIKKMLKMPFSKAPVSMMIHRVGRTLLIDNFDVYRHILLQQEADWKWMRRFIYDHILKSVPNAEQALVPANLYKREFMNEKYLLSKFLYHSLQNQTCEFLPVDNNEIVGDVDESDVSSAGTILPDPLEQQGTSSFTQEFERNILWQFEDLRMLIGSDMPIFGGGTHPCVSLRLRDMRKPINVLTGIDYWLDNLMCNVPEVAMCYHLEGIVQKYEIIATEDLPGISETPFSPQLIRDVAQNILSFLKSNVTKEGHTYWLLKAKDDDVVKLYDLTTICPEYMDETDANPFTVPVAVLLYKVAKNLAQQATRSRSPRKSAGTIYRLLNEALDILPKEKLPQIAGSVHYLLSNIYLSYGLMIAQPESVPVRAEENRAEAVFEDDFDSTDWYTGDDWKSTAYQRPNLGGKSDSKSTAHHQPSAAHQRPNLGGKSFSQVSLESLIQAESAELPHLPPAPNSPVKQPIPNCTSVEDCCKEALEHVYEGLVRAEEAEKTFPRAEEENRPENTERDPAMPIPLQFRSLETSTMNLSIVPLAVQQPFATTWQVELTSLLLLKAVNAYQLLAECSSKIQNYGKSLRYIKLALLCIECCSRLVAATARKTRTLKDSENRCMVVLPELINLCGDVHLMLAKESISSLQRHKAEMQRPMYRDETIAAKASKLIGDENREFKFSFCNAISDSIEENLQISYRCYETALKEINLRAKGNGSELEFNSENLQEYVVNAVDVSRRLGNNRNELGVYYMNLAHTMFNAHDDMEDEENGEKNVEVINAEEEIEVEKKNGIKSDEPEILEQIDAISKKSYASFLDGIKIFEKIGDKPNVALLYSNCGRLMRFCAFCNSEEGKEVTAEERHYYQKAIDMYQKALDQVHSRNDLPIWQSIIWELSSAYFNLADQLQSRPPLRSQEAEEIEREIVELMKKSLQLVDLLDKNKTVGGGNVKHDVYAFRAARIHHKLACMHHRAYRLKEANDRKQKQLKSLL